MTHPTLGTLMQHQPMQPRGLTHSPVAPRGYDPTDDDKYCMAEWCGAPTWDHSWVTCMIWCNGMLNPGGSSQSRPPSAPMGLAAMARPTTAADRRAHRRALWMGQTRSPVPTTPRSITCPPGTSPCQGTHGCYCHSNSSDLKCPFPCKPDTLTAEPKTQP